ncbi:elongation factor 1 [Tieghemostelium lacteum]|uniref:Transcription elongation factor 1 homolog n=1 Tax=Tieghemostelium lacteum TaxID=361077 RepID=A0A151ZB35_TIELA|nr:elongation factor 1 [Tieghemostelium lacteum]|eukprot:KYQ91094.1 elongation factor 1 [Tieghemostelium lacteum]
MGKRKSSKPPPKKAVPKLAKQFDCPFCDHTQTVECTLDKGQGVALCRTCNASFTTTIHELSDAVDVYSDWIDACEAANR